MRVLHVIPGMGSGGGAERSLAGTVGHLVEAGVDLHVAILTDRRALVGQVESDGAVTHDLSAHDRVLDRARAIGRLVQRLQPDVVHASLFDADVPTQLAIGRRYPVLVTWTGAPYAEALRAEPGPAAWKVDAVRLLEMTLGRWSGAWYQAVTEGVASENGRALRVPSRRVIVAGRGRPGVARLGAEVRSETREALGIADDVPMLLAVARHEPEKGLGTLLDAMGTLSADLVDARLVIAGRTGSLTQWLHRALAERSLEHCVSVVGHRTDLDRLMCAADVVVSSSTTEGAAGSILEAMAAGRPVVATNAAGMQGVLTADHDALVVPVGDAPALAHAVRRVLGDPALAARLGRGAALTHATRFTVEQSAASLLEAYRLVSDAHRSKA